MGMDNVFPGIKFIPEVHAGKPLPKEEQEKRDEITAQLKSDLKEFRNEKEEELRKQVPVSDSILEDESFKKFVQDKTVDDGAQIGNGTQDDARKRRFKLGQTVYHRDVYKHCEPLKIVGIRENELELEGDYSGGTNAVRQKQWMPIKGVSVIYNHAYKLECRNKAIKIADTQIYQARSFGESLRRELIRMVLELTEDVELNPEF